MSSVAITILINVILRNSVAPCSPYLKAVVMSADTAEDNNKMKQSINARQWQNSHVNDIGIDALATIHSKFILLECAEFEMLTMADPCQT